MHDYILGGEETIEDIKESLLSELKEKERFENTTAKIIIHIDRLVDHKPSLEVSGTKDFIEIMLKSSVSYAVFSAVPNEV